MIGDWPIPWTDTTERTSAVQTAELTDDLTLADDSDPGLSTDCCCY